MTREQAELVLAIAERRWRAVFPPKPKVDPHAEMHRAIERWVKDPKNQALLAHMKELSRRRQQSVSLTPAERRPIYYRLEGRKPVPCDAFSAGAELMKDRRVAEDKFVVEFEPVCVSTVFLVIDHGFGGRPRLFETMVFGGRFDSQCERYSTWDEAVAGHARWQARVFGKLTVTGRVVQ